MNPKVKIEIDDCSGFCFGVVNAITKAEELLAEHGEVYCLGDIVHNRLEVQRLEQLGLRTIRHDQLSDLRGKNLLIRAHGEPPATYDITAKENIAVFDATCPVVAKLQNLVAQAYRQMQEQDGQVVILGKRGHAEVVGLTGHADGKAIVVEGFGDLDLIDFDRPIFLLSQTTQSLALFGELKDEILNRAKYTDKVIVRDTICRQVANREEHLREFAARFDTVIFVCGRKSSNGKVLFEVCKSENPRCHLIEDGSELREEWFTESRSVGICGATSTPHWLMEKAAKDVDMLLHKGGR